MSPKSLYYESSINVEKREKEGVWVLLLTTIPRPSPPPLFKGPEVVTDVEKT